MGYDGVDDFIEYLNDLSCTVFFRQNVIATYVCLSS